ncbi:MAG: magnesium transporter CorA family protein [Calditrichota bacterium]
MLKHYQVQNRRFVEVQEEPHEVTVFINPDEAEKRFLLDKLCLDEHTYNSAFDPDELSRLEFEPEHIAIICKRPLNYSGAEEFLFRVGSMGIYLFRDRLIILINEDAPLFDGLTQVRSASVNSLMLRMIFRSIVHFREHLKTIAQISDALQEKINTSLENRHLYNMFTLQKSLVYYQNSINSNGVLIDKLKNNASRLGFTTEEIETLDDILIENNQCLKQADIYSNILASLMDARASIVSNNLNVLMKTLNIITISIMVPTFVVSAFSMNVKIPLAGHPGAFVIILGLALLSVLGFMIFWKHRKW